MSVIAIAIVSKYDIHELQNVCVDNYTKCADCTQYYVYIVYVFNFVILVCLLLSIWICLNMEFNKRFKKEIIGNGRDKMKGKLYQIANRICQNIFYILSFNGQKTNDDDVMVFTVYAIFYV